MAPTGVVSWSQTAAVNANSDSTVGWAEGQPPSSINDSARAMMASVAKYRDDTAGSLITGGTSTSYTVASNQGFASKSAMNGAEIAITIHATNGAAATLNVDGLGADPIIIDTNGGTTPVPSATLLTGGVYSLVYYSSGNTWRLKDFYQLPFTVPIGGMIDFTGTTSPSSNFVFPYGQAVSRSVYSTYFGMVGTTYGTGDGSTTFNLPDVRGRIVAGKDDMGGSAASRLTSTYFGQNPAAIGAVGGAETKTIVTANLPAYTPSGSVSLSSGNTTIINPNTIISIQGTGGGSVLGIGWNTGGTIANMASSMSASFTGTAQGGVSTPFALAQPTIILNKLLRII
ncbi:phage tail protein [Bradyrhizobium sp. SEMIA]|uniref:phage tail protein n=1 Tax=Bradyrhizobium sp. SEMIA TaxID=2597515 RepID=UPI0018A65962|nr:tail fiber protein [Bradyrhizobium sp. SEMIA]QOG17913.1 phage tail protein [Bradyrhizobium sp. SEMIA]